MRKEDWSGTPEWYLVRGEKRKWKRRKERQCSEMRWDEEDG